MRQKLKQVADLFYEGVIRNPRTTIAGLSAIAMVFFPQHKEQISAIAIALVGILSKDATPDDV